MIHLCFICNTEGESPDENLPRKWKRVGESAISGSPWARCMMRTS